MKLRHEMKHRINLSDIVQLKSRLSAFLQHDTHAHNDGTYCIRSLYFDNYMDKALKEKCDGVDRREKFRIRFYGDDTSFIRLEKKSKIRGMCQKESVRITGEQCQKIIDGDIGFLLQSEHNLLRELYAKMHYQLLRPRCIVAYKRECFVYHAGNVRVTIDTEICGSYDVKSFLNTDVPLQRLCNTAVLEVKWDEFLPQVIRDAVQQKSRLSASFSKYAAVRF